MEEGDGNDVRHGRFHVMRHLTTDKQAYYAAAYDTQLPHVLDVG